MSAVTDFESTFEHLATEAGGGWTVDQKHRVRHLFYTGGLAMLAAINDMGRRTTSPEEANVELNGLNEFMREYMKETYEESKRIGTLNTFTSGSPAN